MLAMQANIFGGKAALALTEIPRPVPSQGKVLVRMTAAGVTPLDHTILTGHFPMATAPLVLGNEGAGIVDQGGDANFPNGSRVMFTGPYGVFENGSFSEWVAVSKDHLCRIPDNISDSTAAGIPVAYLTAYLALEAAGFEKGMSVFAPAIGGSVGNAVTQLAKAMGGKYAVSTTTSSLKAEAARKKGFTEVIDLSKEDLAKGIMRLTENYGTDIIIDAIGAHVLSAGLGTLRQGGSLTTLGYAAGRMSTIDVTDLIWKGASIRSFLLFSHSIAARNEAWSVMTPLISSGAVLPLVARSFPLADAAEALRFLMEDRPLGRVVLTI